jgi:transcriptional regulator with XRE-family HTH domain
MAPLASVRKRRLLTLRELAEQAHVSLSTLYAIERGERRPQMRVIRQLAAALNVDPLEVDEFRRVIEPERQGLAA